MYQQCYIGYTNSTEQLRGYSSKHYEDIYMLEIKIVLEEKWIKNKIKYSTRYSSNAVDLRRCLNSSGTPSILIEIFCGSPSLPGICWDSTSGRLWVLPFRSFLIRHSACHFMLYSLRYWQYCEMSYKIKHHASMYRQNFHNYIV